MSPSEHLTWFEDNVRWFATLDPALLPVPVPACPGWDVEYVVLHLAFGLGRGYPVALATAADAPQSDPVDWPSDYPRGAAAQGAFRDEMDRCLDTFRATDPTTPCWTYAGPGTAAFWFRRAAIETALHRLDVAEAVGDEPTMPTDRTHDAIAETVEFALPFGTQVLGIEPAAIEIGTTAAGANLHLGTGAPAARVTGSGAALLAWLWGRGDTVEIEGDADAAGVWSGVTEAAFSGR